MNKGALLCTGLKPYRCLYHLIETPKLRFVVAGELSFGRASGLNCRLYLIWYLMLMRAERAPPKDPHGFLAQAERHHERDG